MDIECEILGSLGSVKCWFSIYLQTAAKSSYNMDLGCLPSSALQLPHTLRKLLQDLNSEIGDGEVLLEHNCLTH